MKNLKTTIGLSVLALACLGAGALSVKPTVSAYAEESTEQTTVTTTDKITMKNGAEICVESDFNGIRWETTVEAGYLAEENTQFGVIVAPTKNIDGEFTHGTADVLDLAFEANTIDTTKEVTYYSVIDYSKLTENFNSAYALELTARAYVKTTEGYVYADLAGVTTGRSARQVAIHNELNGKLAEYRASEDEAEQAKAEKAVEYYGGTQYTLTEDKKIFDKKVALANREVFPTTPSLEVAVTGVTSSENLEVVVDAERVNATYADGKVTITDLDYIADGEHYVSVFQGGTLVDVQPMIYATKVFITAKELKFFSAKGEATSLKPAEAEFAKVKEFPGYYVLGANINPTYEYIHGSEKADGSMNNTTWQSYDKYVDKPIGLTGTFNGLGYELQKFYIGTKYEGMFGIVNGGTVKNVWLYYPMANSSSSTYVLGQYLIDATIENVMITTHKDYASVSNALLASYAVNTTVSDCFFRYKGSAGGLLFYDHKEDTVFNNVYVWADSVKSNFLSIDVETVEKTTTTDPNNTPDDTTDDVTTTTTTYKYKDTAQVTFLPMVLKAPNPKDLNKETGELTDPDNEFSYGKIYYAENQVKDPNAETIEPKKGFEIPESAVSAYTTIGVYKGIFCYNAAADFYAAGHDLSGFNTRFWKCAENAFPTWIGHQK